jgi:hypothetical protein
MPQGQDEEAVVQKGLFEEAMLAETLHLYCFI